MRQDAQVVTQVTGQQSAVRKTAAKSVPWKHVKDHKYFYIMLLPVLAWYIIFCYLPMYGIVTAFQDYSMYKGTFHSPFVGLEHFRTLMEDSFFWRAFRNSVIIAVYRLVFEFPIPIILAIMINELRQSWLRKTIQTIVYLPNFLSWIIVASIVFTILNPDIGVIAEFMKQMGIEKRNLVTPDNFRGLLIITDIWKTAGWGTIIFLASMSGIDLNLYEAAYVDGADRFHRIWHITLPAIRNVIAIVLILMVGSVLRTGFDQVFNMGSPMVMETGDIIDTYVTRTVMRDYKLSYAAAIGLFNSVICAILLFSSNFAARKLNQDSIY